MDLAVDLIGRVGTKLTQIQQITAWFSRRLTQRKSRVWTRAECRDSLRMVSYPLFDHILGSRERHSVTGVGPCSQPGCRRAACRFAPDRCQSRRINFESCRQPHARQTLPPPRTRRTSHVCGQQHSHHARCRACCPSFDPTAAGCFWRGKS